MEEPIRWMHFVTPGPQEKNKGRSEILYNVLRAPITKVIHSGSMLYVSEERVTAYRSRVYPLSAARGLCAQSGQGLTIAGDYIELGFNF